MSRPTVYGLVSLVLLASSGCTGLDARYRQPPLPVTDAWPVPAAGAGSSAADIGWREFFVDARLRQLIAKALDTNRDLRIAVLTVEKARAEYRIQRSARVPSIDATGSATRQLIPASLTGGTQFFVPNEYQVTLGVSAFELDLFGRVASLSRAALQQYLAQAEARRAAQLSLIAEVANAYLTLAADQELRRLAEQTLKSRDESYQLTEKRHELGAVSALDLSQMRTTVESARADVAHYAGAVAQDLSALTLLVGATIEPNLMPEGFDPQVSGLAPLPAELPSVVLLRRPDVLEAEHVLRSADANIGAARAAFFPHISLTGDIGSASTELSGLFKSGTRTWSFTPQVTLPIFEGGRLRAGLGMATADRGIAGAQYEKAIPVGFREVSDALALTDTLGLQRDAQQALVAATGNAFQLSEQRYKAGKDSYLTFLDAQRSDYVAQQGLISTRLAEQTNRVTLYKVLGGGWREGPQ